MELFPPLLSVSVTLLLLPAAAANESDPRQQMLWDLAVAAEDLLEAGLDPGLLPDLAPAGVVCAWYEPGAYVETIVVDVNHYLVQIPVPAIISEGGPVGMNGEPAGTYFIQVSFSGSDCSS